MELAETVGILLWDCLFCFKDILNIGYRQGKVRLVNIHRINPKFHVTVMLQLLSLPVIPQSACIKAGCPGMIVIARYRHSGEFDGLSIDKFHLLIALRQRVRTKLFRVLLLKKLRKRCCIIIYCHMLGPLFL